MTHISPDVKDIIFAERSVPSDGHWYANIGYAAPGVEVKKYGTFGRLNKLNLKTGKVTQLLDDPEGAVRDPQLHYDGRTILFSYRPGGTDYYHLYEMQIDGSGLRQLTDGPFDDFEATYLPNDKIMFVSTRCRRWVQCWLTHVAVLHTCDRNGENIMQISANIEHDNTPWPLPDGRVLYQRWEYIDRSQVHYHHLWTTNPDGTAQMVYYGNLTPGIVMIDAKPIPGTQEVISIFSPGHGSREHAGHITLLAQSRGPDDPAAPRQLHKNRNFRDPFPLSADLFLSVTEKEILLMNRTGKTQSIYQQEKQRAKKGIWLHEPRPVVARERERIIAPRANYTDAAGTLLLYDVYEGRTMSGVKRGAIKQLLVVESLPKPINYTGGMDPMSYGGTFTLERILGTVPVAEDGSAMFEAPALRSLFFIALDEQKNAVKRMQSFTSIMPGEQTGCVGCHEHRTLSPRSVGSNMPVAMQHMPHKIKPLSHVPDVFDFPRDIQPLLDKHCVICHNPQKAAGGVLLTGDRGPMFSHSYYELTRTRQIADGRNQAVSNRPPYTIGAVASPLINKIDGSHHDVRLTDNETDMIRYWIEVGAPYPGTYGALGNGAIGGYAENKQVHTDYEWPESKAVKKVVQRRCASCHHGDKNLPVALSDEIGLSFWQPSFSDPRLQYSRHRLFNLSHPELSLMTRAPLSTEQGGLGKCAHNGEPVFTSKDDPDYITLLRLSERGRDELNEMQRFDMPDFQPTDAYVREMKRYGILEADVVKDSLDVCSWDAMNRGPHPLPRAPPA